MIDTFASVGATRFDLTWTNARRRKGMVPAQRDLADLTPHPARDARYTPRQDSATSSCGRMAPA